jgi:hypothetical protein
MRAEFRMNVISDATWMKAANSGFRKPRLASTMPIVSTAIVPHEILPDDVPRAPGGFVTATISARTESEKLVGRHAAATALCQ